MRPRRFQHASKTPQELKYVSKSFQPEPPILTNCTFTDNSAEHNGGGMYIHHTSSPTLTECTFTDNSAADFGGGMFNDASSPDLTECTFTGNSADSSGGGMWNNLGGSPTLFKCTFTNKKI